MDSNLGAFFLDSSNMHFTRFITGALTKNSFNKKSLGFSRIVEGLAVFFFIISFAPLEASRKIIKSSLFSGESRDQAGNVAALSSFPRIGSPCIKLKLE